MKTQLSPIANIRPFPAKQRGFSLIEALISLLIASFGMVGLVGMHLKLNANADVSKQRTEAVRLAVADMENLRVLRTVIANESTLCSVYDPNVLYGPSDPLYQCQIRWDSLLVTTLPTVVSTGTSSNPFTSNATYTLTRAVTDSAVAKMKDVQVRVAWNDRTGVEQSVVLRSFVAGIDPSVALSLSVAPNGSPVRDTLGRDIQVPIPANNLGGESVFKPRSDSTTAYVFDNDTGMITRVCTNISSTTQNAGIVAADVATGVTGCTEVTAYLLSGFIRYATGNLNNNYDPTLANEAPPSGTTWGIGLVMNDVAPATSGTHGLLSLLSKNSTAWSSAISNSRYSSLPSCSAESLKTISFTAAVSFTSTNNGSTTTTTSTKVYLTVPKALTLTAANVLPYTKIVTNTSQISGIVDQNENYVGYSCIVYPIDLDGSSSTPLPLTPLAWTGRPALTALNASSASVIGTTSSTFKVCRFSQDYNLNGYVWLPATPLPATATNQSVTKIDNEEHPYAYLNVSKSLSNQNYLVIKGSNNCPTDTSVEVDGTGNENYTDATTVTHQP